MVLPNLPSYRRFKKIISLLVAVSFVSSNIAFADIPNTTTQDTKKEVQITTDPEKIVVPRDYGLIKSRYTSKDARKLIIHIQDAHCNYEAQSNIIKILECLIKNDGLGLVSVEGADGFIDTSWFKAFPDAEIRKEVADYFMKKGEITGPEFLAITSDYPVKLFGAETRSYYIDNLNAFTSSYPLKEDTEKYYNQIRAVLNKIKATIYNEELKEFDAKQQDYETKKLSFTDYVKYLEGMAGKYRLALRQYENLFKLVSVLVYEKKINFNVVDKERATLIDTITKKLDKDQLKELVNKSLEFKVGKIASTEYYDYLRKLSAKYDISLVGDYPNLFNYIIYNSVYSRIENEKLFNDIKKFEEAVKDKLFENDDQRALDKLWRSVNILLGLVNIKLLNDDFDYYKAHKEEFAHELFANFISKMASKFGFAYEIDPPSQAVSESMPKLEDFYAIAIKRDKALVDNTIQAMNKEKAQVSVLVTGGFHSEGITKLLEKQDISYVVVCPNITKEVETPYIKILTNQRTPLEEILTDTGAKTADAKAKGTMLAPYLITGAMSHEKWKIPDIVYERSQTDLKKWAELTIELWLPKAKAVIEGRHLKFNVDMAIACFNLELDRNVDKYTENKATNTSDRRRLKANAENIKSMVAGIIKAAMAKPADLPAKISRAEAYSSPEKFQAYVAERMKDLISAIPELEGLIKLYRQIKTGEERKTLKEAIDIIVNVAPELASDLKQRLEKIGKNTDLESKDIKKAIVDSMDDLIRVKYNAPLIEKTLGFMLANVGEKDVVNDIKTLRQFLSSPDNIRYMEMARELMFSRSRAKIDLFGGAASRLFGEGSDRDPSLSYFAHDVYAVADSRNVPIPECAIRGISIGTRLAIQEWINTEEEIRRYYQALGISKSDQDIKEEREKILAETPRIVIVNDENCESILKEFLANNFYGYDKNLTVFVMQNTFNGFDVRDGAPVVTAKKESLANPAGHGDSTMQVVQEGRAFLLNAKGEVITLKENAVDYLMRKTNGSIKIFIQSRVNDMIKLGDEAAAHPELTINEIDMAIFALALSQMGDLDNIGTGRNAILEQVGQSAESEKQVKGSSPLRIGNHEFLVEGLAQSPLVKSLVTKQGVPFNRFFIFYKPGALTEILKNQGLPVCFRFRDGYLYPEVVTGDITLLKGMNAGWALEETRQINDYKDGEKTLENGIRAALKQDQNPIFKRHISQVNSKRSSVALKGIEKIKNGAVGAIRENGGEITAAEHGTRGEVAERIAAENSINGIIARLVKEGSAYSLAEYRKTIGSDITLEQYYLGESRASRDAAESPTVKENFAKLFFSDRHLNFIIIEGLRDALIKSGVAPDLIFHPGVRRNAIYIDEGDFLYLLSLPNGVDIIKAAMKHEKTHIDNPRLPEDVIEVLAPSYSVRLALLTRGMLKDQRKSLEFTYTDLYNKITKLGREYTPEEVAEEYKISLAIAAALLDKVSEESGFNKLKREMYQSMIANTPDAIKNNPLIDTAQKGKATIRFTRENLEDFDPVKNPKGMNLKSWLARYKKEASVSTAGIRGVQNILFPNDPRELIGQKAIILATVAKALVAQELKAKGYSDREIHKLASSEVRFNSKEYVEFIARIQAALGIKTHVPVGGETIPIWMASFLIFKYDLFGGEYVTSSHAISKKIATKDLSSEGSQYIPDESILFVNHIEEIIKTIEEKGEYAITLAATDDANIDQDFMKKINNGIDDYVTYLQRGIATPNNLNLINKGKNKIYIDVVGGSMYRTMKAIFDKLGISSRFNWLHKKEDPYFHGIGKGCYRLNTENGKLGFEDLSCDTSIVVINAPEDVAKIKGFVEKFKDRIAEKAIGEQILIPVPNSNSKIFGQIRYKFDPELKLLGENVTIDLPGEKVLVFETNTRILPVIRTMGYKQSLKSAPVGTVIELTDPDGDRLITAQIVDIKYRDKLKELGLAYEMLDKDRVLVVFMPNQSFLMTIDFRKHMLKKDGEWDKRNWFMIKTTASAAAWDDWAAAQGDKSYKIKYAGTDTWVTEKGVPVINTPVGFKEIASIMKKVEKQMREAPDKEVIIEDIFGNQINIGVQPRLLFAGEESGGEIFGPTELIKSANGRLAIAMREKSAGEAMVITSAMAADLEAKDITLVDYLLNIFEESKIINRFDYREDIIYFNESEPDINIRKQAEAEGLKMKEENDFFFLAIGIALRDEKITFEQAKGFLEKTFPAVDFTELKAVYFVGDGVYLKFSDRVVEIRPSGTEAKTKGYAMGASTKTLVNDAKALAGYYSESMRDQLVGLLGQATHEAYFKEAEFMGTKMPAVKVRAMEIYNAYLANGAETKQFVPPADYGYLAAPAAAEKSRRVSSVFTAHVAKIVDLSARAGLPVKLNMETGEISLGKGVISEPRWSRPLKDAGDSVADTKAVANDPVREIYYGFRNVRSAKDDNLVDSQHLRFDITVLRPGVIGKEFIMTKGHIHDAVPNTGTFEHPEIYEVWNGKALYVQQGINSNTGKFEFVITLAMPGDKVLLIPGYSHRTVNIGSEPLVMANWISDEVNGKEAIPGGRAAVPARVKANFKEIEQKHGYAYWVMRTSDGKVEFIQNPNYGEEPASMRFTTASPAIPELEISRETPMYNLIDSANLSQFLRNPNWVGPIGSLPAYNFMSKAEFMNKVNGAVSKTSQASAPEAEATKVTVDSIENDVTKTGRAFGMDIKDVQNILIGSINKTMLLNDFAESVGIKKDKALKNMVDAGLARIVDAEKSTYELTSDFCASAKLKDFVAKQIATSDNPKMVDLTTLRIERIILNAVVVDKFFSILQSLRPGLPSEAFLNTANAFPTLVATALLAKASTGKGQLISLKSEEIVSTESGSFYKSKGVDVQFSLPSGLEVNASVLKAIKAYQYIMIKGDMARGGYNYRGTGTRQTIEQFFKDYFMKEWHGKIVDFIKARFNENKPLKAIVTNGIGANDQFMWSLVKMYNENRPEGAPKWYHMAMARDLDKLVEDGITGENALFIDISRSGGTWEGVEVGIRSLAMGFTNRIALANGGAVKAIALKAAEMGGYEPLVIGMSPDIGGRNMHRKTTIYYTAQTVAGMFFPKMEANTFAYWNDKFDKANDFSDSDKSLAANTGKFLHASMVLMGVEHIAMVTNTEALRLAATEWEQYIMEGCNKEHVISLGIHDLSKEPGYVLNNMVNSPAGKITIGIVMLDVSAPTYTEDMKRINVLKEKMPLMIFTIDSKQAEKEGYKGGISPTQQAAFDILWTDMVTSFTTLLRVDANSNPNVKIVREYTAARVANAKDAEKAYKKDAIGIGEAEVLISYGTSAESKIGSEGIQSTLTIDNAAEMARKLVVELSSKGLLTGRNRLNLSVGRNDLLTLVNELRNATYNSGLGIESGWITQTALFALWSHKGLEAQLGSKLAAKSINIFFNARRAGSAEILNQPFDDLGLMVGDKRPYAGINGATIHQTNDAMTIPNIKRMAEVSPTILFEFNDKTNNVEAIIRAFYEAFIEQLGEETGGKAVRTDEPAPAIEPANFDHTEAAMFESSATGERAREMIVQKTTEPGTDVSEAHLIFVETSIPERQISTTTALNVMSTCVRYYAGIKGYTVHIVDTPEDAVKLLAKNPDWNKANTIIGLVTSKELEALSSTLSNNGMKDKTKLLAMEKVQDDQYVPIKGFIDLMATMVRINKPLDKGEDREMLDEIRKLLNQIGVANTANLVDALSAGDYFEDPIKFAKNFIIKLLPPVKAYETSDLKERYNAAKKVIESL